MAFISQIVSVIDNQDGTFTTQVMVFTPNQPASVAHLERPKAAGRFSDDELAALLNQMNVQQKELGGSKIGPSVPVVSSVSKAVDFKAGCPQCEAKQYHTAHSEPE